MARMINIGFGNVVSMGRVIVVVSPDSAPTKRLITGARDSGKLIDVTHGRRTRSVIVTDSDHVILSSVHVSTLSDRAEAVGKPARQESDDEADEDE